MLGEDQMPLISIGMARNGNGLRNNDELSSQSCVSIISLAFHATLHYLNINSDPNSNNNPNTNSLFRFEFGAIQTRIISILFLCLLLLTLALF